MNAKQTSQETFGGGLCFAAYCSQEQRRRMGKAEGESAPAQEDVVGVGKITPSEIVYYPGGIGIATGGFGRNGIPLGVGHRDIPQVVPMATNQRALGTCQESDTRGIFEGPAEAGI